MSDKSLEFEVAKFREYVLNERWAQYEKYTNSEDCFRIGEKQKLVDLNNINIYPKTKEELETLKISVQDILDRKVPKTEQKVEKKETLNTKEEGDHYTAEMLFAMLAPSFFICFLPVILMFLCFLTCCLSDCNGCRFCDFCFSEFMFFWLFSIPITGPIAVLLMLPGGNAVNKKYGYETDDLTKGAIIASAVGCAVSNMKQTKKSVKNLLNQNGKTEV